MIKMIKCIFLLLGIQLFIAKTTKKTLTGGGGNDLVSLITSCLILAQGKVKDHRYELENLYYITAPDRAQIFQLMKLNLIKECMSSIDQNQAEEIRNNTADQKNLLYTTFDDFVKNSRFKVNDYLVADLDPLINRKDDLDLLDGINMIEQYFPEFSIGDRTIFVRSRLPQDMKKTGDQQKQNNNSNNNSTSGEEEKNEEFDYVYDQFYKQEKDMKWYFWYVMSVKEYRVAIVLVIFIICVKTYDVFQKRKENKQKGKVEQKKNENQKENEQDKKKKTNQKKTKAK